MMGKQRRLMWVSALALVLGVVGPPSAGDTMVSIDRDAERARLERLQLQVQRSGPAKILARQDTMITAAVRAVSPGVKLQRDLFVVGIAGDGTQDVFLSEVEFAARALDQRYGTQKRTVLLVNNLRSVGNYPLATDSALRTTLKLLAAKMNGAEDILLLFMTSHGSPDRTISLQFPGFNFDALSAGQVRRALDDAGIANRVIIISACYSGSFIPTLENGTTAIMTAAAFNRTSFGCSNERQLTYFGDAFFKAALPKAASLTDAFDKSLMLIADWERRDGFVHSQPMISIGANAQPLLDDIEKTAVRQK